MRCTAMMIALGMAMVLVPAAAHAQQAAITTAPPASQQLAAETGSTGPVSWGTVFGAPGLITDGDDSVATLYFGGGWEVVWPSGIGFAVDGGYTGRTSGLEYGAFVFAPGVIYEFPLEGATRPYVRGGYTLLFRDGAANLVHFGGGVNHWLNERLGLKFEVRDNIYLADGGGSPHFLDFIVGLTIRPGS